MGILIKEWVWMFYLTNKVLAYDVQIRSRSLGFSAYLKECTKKYNTTKKGHFYSVEVKAYRFNISGDALIEAPIIAKKRKVLRRKQKKRCISYWDKS